MHDSMAVFEKVENNHSQEIIYIQPDQSQKVRLLNYKMVNKRDHRLNVKAIEHVHQ
jgi:hypothetical protein